MANVAVFNPVFRRGGSDAVMMHIIDALQKSHQITCVSFNEPDIRALNAYFNTGVGDINVIGGEKLMRMVPHSMNVVKKATGKWMGSLHIALMTRKLKSIFSSFDLVISSGEIPVECPKIQYVHYPRFFNHELTGSVVDNIYQRACQKIGRYDKSTLRSGRLLTNSNWTKDIVDSVYSTNSQIVYPPVDVHQFGATDWVDQEEGFVCIGRIDKNKNIHRNIAIVDELVERGHNLHIHIIGPSRNNKYCDRVEQMANARPYVHLEGKVCRKTIIRMVDSHKYGIHGMENEHFGIAVAEMVAGKTIPVVPDGGGQTEIVKQLDELKYTSQKDAVNKLETIVSNGALQQRILQTLSDAEQRFGKERFYQRIRETVSREV